MQASQRSRGLVPSLISAAVANVAIVTGMLPALSAFAVGEAKPVRIGIAKTFFNEKSEGYVDIATGDFKEVMKKMTGLDGKLFRNDSAAEIADKLDKKQLDLGVFHAHEFAWVQQKHADLRTLLVAVNKQHEERAYLIVHQSGPKSVDGLRGKKIDMPEGTKEVCRLYIRRYCTGKDYQDPAKFFGSIAKSATPEGALDDVARGKTQATIVDTLALSLYKEIRGPVFDKNLTVLQRSNPFPPAVIVCKPGGLDEATVAKFRDGLLKAHDTPEGRDMMELWKITAFEPVPKDYASQLADVLKEYPAPK